MMTRENTSSEVEPQRFTWRQDKLIFGGVFVCALSLLGLVWWSMGQLEFHNPPTGALTMNNYQNISEEEKVKRQRARLDKTVDQWKKAEIRGDRKGALTAHGNMGQLSPAVLRDKYDGTTDESTKTALLVSLGQKGRKEDSPLFRKVFQESRSIAQRRYALVGLARSNPKEAVELISREILSMQGKAGLIWQLYGVEALYQAGTKKAVHLLGQLARTSPHQAVRAKAAKYQIYAKKRSPRRKWRIPSYVKR